MKETNLVLETSGGEMPDPRHTIVPEAELISKSVFAHKPVTPIAIKELLPESHGDSADQAQLEVDSQIEEKVSAVRLKNVTE